jgi:hypothetical protein
MCFDTPFIKKVLAKSFVFAGNILSGFGAERGKAGGVRSDEDDDDVERKVD